MTIYYAVCSSIGDSRIAGVHLTAESAQHSVQSWQENTVKCQPFMSFKEAQDYIANQVSIPAIGDVLVAPVATVPLDVTDETSTTGSSKKRKAWSTTSMAQNGKNDKKWADKYLKLKQFIEEIADGNASLVMDSSYQRQDLSGWIQRQREIYRAWKQGHFENSARAIDHQARFMMLLELGVKLDAPHVSEWQKMANRWKTYHFPRGVNTTPSPTSIIEPLKEDTDRPELRELFLWQVAQQEEFKRIVEDAADRVHLYPHRCKLLQEWSFPFPKCSKRQKRSMLKGSGPKTIRKTFEERLEEFVAYKAEHGTPFVPTIEAGGLGEWCKKQRQRSLIKLQGQIPLDGITISDEKIQRLREAGFSFELPKRAGRKPVTDGEEHDVDDEPKQQKRNMRSFDERLQDFIDWKNEHGTALVPQSMKGLGDWVHTQRRQYAKKLKGQTNCMSENRIRKLLAAGFIFDGNEARKQDAVAKQQKSSVDSEQQSSLHLETSVAAHRVVAMGHSDPNPLGWF